MSEDRGNGQHEIEHIRDTVDHISNLPDCILHHMLSSMPTKEVVKTSILSTRWKNLWVSAPNIDFDYGISSGGDVYEASFMNFVERVLHSRSASNIGKFCLSLSFFGRSYNESEIRSCISSAIMHNVQELDLSLFAQEPAMIPRSLFDNTSLVILKINTYCVGELPSYVSIPCLKILQLNHVVLPNDGYIEKLLSGCPNLEELVLSRCFNIKNTVISCSTLKSLTIYDFEEFYNGYCYKIEVDATNLTYFEYTGYRSNKILLKNVPSLVTACIHISTLFMSQKEVARLGVDLLKQLQNVMSLRLPVCIIESFGLVDACFPVFPNLSHLMLTTEVGNDALRALMDLIYVCPVLQSISLYKVFKNCLRLGENNPIWSLIPMCMPNGLKKVTINNFHAYDSEICLLKCFLKHAHVLEDMNIRWSKNRPPDLKKKTEAREEIKTLERSSSACVINFL